MSEVSHHTRIVNTLEDLFAAVTMSTKDLSASINHTLAAIPVAGIASDKQRESSLRKSLYPAIEKILLESQYCSGAGFASHLATENLAQPYWFLEWWFKNPKSNQQSCLDLDQATQQRLDFSTFEWFKNTPEAEDVYLHGPYVDYVCTSAYTITAASPVLIDGNMVGVAAVDILVSRIEEALLPMIKQTSSKVIITNNDNRVIFSSHLKYRTGSLVNIDATYQTTQNNFCKITFL
ncbi:cache domain-containing protein [Pantoea sp. EA-12]|uniref:cache domain-containing protein n=1 Tax=Pantoea sp. EA-12 TaxID=3043303 RepID=UPI0024B52B4B|nr:cache domain-containing protein [Pantoea sp. EA-12]MDI9219404.1 cache domain-containing protein [Pantoea sp. EA-12]